ncbi:MAG: hypothetical protein JNM93_01515 [Bacteriovoracaceae bacterium]|nr:hypothetical protein [Bacteriovoracaceae bacterium]
MFSLLLSLCVQFATHTFASDPHYQRLQTPSYYQLAWGDLRHKKNFSQHPWPFTVLSIGHSNASLQAYGAVEENYFHHGLDIRGVSRDKIYASTGGYVVNVENYIPGNYLYWEIAILDNEGFLWQYHHIAKDSIPTAIWNAFRNKTAISSGEYMGEIVPWPVYTFGEYFHHVHLNILDKDGNYLSPFLFLKPLPDIQTPKIHKIALYQNGRVVEGNSISGNYTMVLNADDLIGHDKFLVPPHIIMINIDKAGPKVLWNFATLPGGASREQYVNKFFLPPSCGDYHCRNFFMNLGFVQDETQSLSRLGQGKHLMEVAIYDFVGNYDYAQFEWEVR